MARGTGSRWLLTLCFAVACGPGISQPGDDASAGTEDSSGTGMTSVGPGTIGEDTTQGPMTSAGPSTTSPGDTSVGPSTDDGPSTGDTGGPACEQTESFSCQGRVGCDGRPCADNPLSPIDGEGCPRPSCPCDKGEVCFTPQDWGACVGSGMTCADDETGQCICVSDDDCGGSYCLPDGEVPTAACGAITDEMDCAAAGCGPFLMGRPITDRGGGACLCDLEEPWCLWVDPNATALPGNTAYVNGIDGRVIVFEAAWDPPPFGWTSCAAHPAPPPECACAEVLPCAMGGL